MLNLTKVIETSTHWAEMDDGQVVWVYAHGSAYQGDEGYDEFRTETEESGCATCKALIEKIDRAIKP